MDKFDRYLDKYSERLSMKNGISYETAKYMINKNMKHVNLSNKNINLIRCSYKICRDQLN